MFRLGLPHAKPEDLCFLGYSVLTCQSAVDQSKTVEVRITQFSPYIRVQGRLHHITMEQMSHRFL